MYICICNAVRECDLRMAANRCPGDAEACFAMLGKRPNCRTCLDEAEEVIADERLMAIAPAYAV